MIIHLYMGVACPRYKILYIVQEIIVEYIVMTRGTALYTLLCCPRTDLSKLNMWEHNNHNS